MSQMNQQLISTDERWKIIFSEQSRAPQFAVCHYVNYLKRLVDVDKGNKQKTKKLKDGIHPVSYLLRKLKVDLKVSYESFVSEFIRAPNNGLQLLLKLLHQLQNTSRQKSASVANKETRLEEFKRQLADELDCLLCLKFTLRCQDAVDRLVGDGQFLRVVCGSLLSNTIKSRIVTLEILTLCLGAKTGFDRVFEMFTWMRINFGEAVRFKLLVSMMFTRAYSQTLFQVTTMRFLNTLLAASGTGNLRVYIQQEVEMAGLDVDVLDKFTRGDGLEFDELRREIEEWKLRYIDVDSLLKSPKPDIWSKEERWRYSTQNLGIDQHGYHDNTDELSPRPYPYGSRELPPIPSMTDIPANSLQLLMSLIHRQKQAEKNDIMQAMKEHVSPPCNHGNQQHPNVTIDYNSGGQELYLAHVYKNTGEMDSEDCLNRPPLKSDQHRRYSHDPSQHRRKTRQETENIYETLNWRSASITKDYSDTCTNGMVTRQRGSTRRLGSLNGNWVLRTHLSMPSLSTIDNPNLSLAQSKDSPSRDETDEPPNDQTSTEPQSSVTYHTLESEPEPDYSPEVSPNATLHKNDADVQKLLNDFDKMLEQHDTRPNTLTGRQTEYIKSGTITFV